MEMCKVKINNEDFNIPCNQLKQLVKVQNRLVNIESNQVTLYKHIQTNYNNTNYPYIVCPFSSACYRNDSNTSYRTVITVNSYELVNKPLNYYWNEYSVYLLFVGVLLCLVKLFHK